MIHTGNNQSPSVDAAEIPASLRNISQDEDLEVLSMRSQRLYTGAPEKYQACKRAQNRQIKQKRLFPELARYQPVAREHSRKAFEFAKQTLTLQSKVTPKTKSGALNKTKNEAPKSHQLVVEGLPSEVKLFLDQALGKFPIMTTQTGSVYVGELVN